MINSNRSSIIVSDKWKHENKLVSSTSIKSIMNKLQTGSKCQNNTDSGQYKEFGPVHLFTQCKVTYNFLIYSKK